MIHPHSHLEKVHVEGSENPDAAGEYVIDVGEVWREANGEQAVRYYQLKHSTVRADQPMPLSELSKTLIGFGARFREKSTDSNDPTKSRTFFFVSNRKVSGPVKDAFKELAAGGKVNNKLRRDIKKATGLGADELRRFSRSLSFHDQEEDYRAQLRELEFEVSRQAPGSHEDGAALRVVGLVWENAMPAAKGERERGIIVREDVLRSLGVENSQDLFPAPLAMESVAKAFLREQHVSLIQYIASNTGQCIITAPGGVGKSVVARQLSSSFPKGSEGLVYDCFGGGNYLNQSKSRHRHCDALVQLANEMASAGLCRTLIANSQKPHDVILRAFLERLREASELIKLRGQDALLVLLIDAADNAEMAAEQYAEKCFASALIREPLPTNCRIVYLCRPERTQLLKAPSRVRKINLNSFSLAESARHLAGPFSDASEMEVKEFHRLTGGNPRVQANSLASGSSSVRDLLNAFGSDIIGVEEQIATQLQSAIDRLRDTHGTIAVTQIESICRGLATLPPFIPIPVLAAAAGVEPDAIKSFISDLGRPLWHSDDSVQFRDEPTETWFRNTYAATTGDLRRYAEAIEPLASCYTYAARSLPSLWHRAGEHGRLIALALNDDFLPENNPIDARDVRIYRLQFALKTALKIDRHKDAAKLALRAGEEMAGNSRQLEILKCNADLVAELHDAHRVQETACKQVLRSGWPGSQNVYSASLLAWHRDFQGEANSYLHASERWLRVHFREREQREAKNPMGGDSLTRADIAELAWATLGLFGPNDFIHYLSVWSPADIAYDLSEIVVRRLIDAGKFADIDAIAIAGSSYPYVIVALCDQLAEVSRFPPKESLSASLSLLAAGLEFAKHQKNSLDEDSTPGLVSFAEACAHHQLDTSEIIAVLGRASKLPALHALSSDYQTSVRHSFARAAALLAWLRNDPLPDPIVLIPDTKPLHGDNGYYQEEQRNCRTILRALLPIYHVRAQIICGEVKWNALPISNVKMDGGKSDLGYSQSRIKSFWDELPLVKFGIFALLIQVHPEDLKWINGFLVPEGSTWHSLHRRIEICRIAYRHEHLRDLGSAFEAACVSKMDAWKSVEPMDRAGWCVGLCRAVLAANRPDAAAYFNDAIEAVSKFGDELVERWTAVTAVAQLSCSAFFQPPELAYRFVRCAEVVGHFVTREKYWDRSEAICVMAQLHPPSVFAALSRWRERDVGDFPLQLKDLATNCTKRGVISPILGFCLTGFEGPRACVDLLEACLKKEPRQSFKQQIFDRTVLDMALDDELNRASTKLLEFADSHHLNSSDLTNRINYAKRNGSAQLLSPNEAYPTFSATSHKEDRITSLVDGLDPSTPEGLAASIALIEAMEFPKDTEKFWAAEIARVPRDAEVQFLNSLLASEEAERFHLTTIFGLVKATWGNHAAVRREWPMFLKGLGRKLYATLAYRGSLAYWRERYLLDDNALQFLREGVQEGIASLPDLLDAGALFGFVEFIAKRLTANEAREVLEFALERFEKHIESDFGDGPWQEWLHPPDTLDSVTGFIWAALGAPVAATRWEAAHCVRRLVEFECKEAIASLLGWLDRDDVAAFLGKDFPFYKYHATLYLLFGIARGGLEKPNVLVGHAEVFVKLALYSVPHALIQLEAAKLALSIARFASNAVSEADKERLTRVGQSPFPPQIVENDSHIEGLWHHSPTPTNQIGPHLAYDFDTYWLPSLARVFGVSVASLEADMRLIMVESLGGSAVPEYSTDPRQDWLKDRSQGTFHSHSSPPLIDTLRFYYSYQALMIAAAKYRRSRPTVKKIGEDEDEEDRWDSWVSQHHLTRRDGRWLADRRDPTLPARSSKSVSSAMTDWRWAIGPDDFFDVLTAQPGVCGGICVAGDWSDAVQGFKENVAITSALVRSCMADSLASAMRTADNFHCFGLPTLLGDGEEGFAEPFDLIQWIVPCGYADHGLDGLDSHANKLSYPPIRLAKHVVQKFGLVADSEARSWHLPSDSSPVAICEAWSEPHVRGEGHYYRYGERLFTTVPFLRRLCETFDRDLIISVRIDRDVERSHRSDDSGSSLVQPYQKIFIFSAHGTLRDTTKDYQLG